MRYGIGLFAAVIVVNCFALIYVSDHGISETFTSVNSREIAVSLNVGRTKVKVPLRNPTEHPVRVFGARSSCGCGQVLNLPLEIPAFGEESIVVEFHGSVKGKGRVLMPLFCDPAEDGDVKLAFVFSAN